ncbi:uncharacterized protein JN550_002498 [Neoarthrinium moseri]|uniref:uncharacterized protein n=1 Tax=Neoarthrinium moseri TaxID=1658444 RepID=UPI001FDB3364|nr:uncharacterized protein JN550_002498 [Neoarthrinium moseri]KAI1875069.1 hypothetical protein JN550_002498 [Neoarthrinium moseri]
MGYSEIACQICGMSFNIGRIRTLTEPRSSGWDYSGYSTGGFIHRHSKSSRFCPPSSGCMVVVRGPVKAPECAIADDEEDDDYVHRPSAELDPYEYDSHHESEPENDTTDGDDDTRSCSSGASETYRAFVQSLASPAAHPEVMIPEHDAPEDEAMTYEHIAGGPACEWNRHSYVEGAFNGHAISVEEMRGCTTLQCFVPKDDDWESGSDDQEFETSGKFFLSGLSDHSPSRDMAWPSVYPSRHDCDQPCADNSFYDTKAAEEHAMPFHPTCLEVFKRASILRSGAVDYEGLINWWLIETGDQFYKFPRDPAVNNEQWFQHVAGNEFVAANPCFGTKLESILAASDRTGDPGFAYDTPVFGALHSTSDDVFARLPRERCLMILDHLESRDIANLRLASRSFYHLPQSLFRSLTLREMPWLWEAWCTLGYSKWAYHMASELCRRTEQHDEVINIIHQAENILREEAYTVQDEGLHQAAIHALQQAAADEEDERDYPSRPAPLQAAKKTDWYRLRCELARNRTRLLGLRNRRRIWTDCEEILDRIARYRGEGTMTLGQMVDARSG